MDKVLIVLTFSMLLGSGLAVAADFGKGFRAYNAGDFKTALTEWGLWLNVGIQRLNFFLG